MKLKSLKDKVRRYYKQGKIGPWQEAWLLTLLSDEWRQCSGHLTNYNRSAHCCLGVFCEVVDQNSPKALPDDWFWRASLPIKLAKMLGLYNGEGEPNYEKSDSNAALVELNDSMSHDFKDIVEIILEDPKVYFSEVK